MERTLLSRNEIIEVEGSSLTVEDELRFEIEGLRLRLDRANHSLKLAEERASLQRIHIAQLQNKLGVGVCRDTTIKKPKLTRYKPKRLAAAAPFDSERAAKGLCQNPYCSKQTERKYCTQSCAMKHRWDNSKGE